MAKAPCEKLRTEGTLHARLSRGIITQIYRGRKSTAKFRLHTNPLILSRMM